MSLFITQLHFRPFPTPDFIKRPVVFAAHFLVLVIKAVGKPRFSSPDIDGLCGVKIIKLALVKMVALTVGDKFLFSHFFFICSMVKNGVSFLSSMATSSLVKW